MILGCVLCCHRVQKGRVFMILNDSRVCVVLPQCAEGQSLYDP